MGYIGETILNQNYAFEKIIYSFMPFLFERVYDEYVLQLGTSFTSNNLFDPEKSFSTYLYARYATNVIFQQCLRPGNAAHERKLYFSGKHKLYGLKVEVSVLSSGITAFCTNDYPGAVSDITIMLKNISIHKSLYEKASYENIFEDTAEHHEIYPNHWAIFCKKGYQGASEFLRVIQTHKKVSNRSLSYDHEKFNSSVNSDRVLLEHYFGRISSL